MSSTDAAQLGIRAFRPNATRRNAHAHRPFASRELSDSQLYRIRPSLPGQVGATLQQPHCR
jgi:hypothetical protein